MNTPFTTEAHIKMPAQLRLTLGNLRLDESANIIFTDKDGLECWRVNRNNIKAYKPSHLIGRIKFYTDNGKRSIYLLNISWLQESNLYKWIRVLRKVGIKRRIV